MTGRKKEKEAVGRNREEQARLEGMAQALRVAREKGIEGLEDEIRMRNITGLPCAVPKKAIDECIQNIKNNVVDTFTVLVAYITSSDTGRPGLHGLRKSLTSRRNA